MVLQRLALTLCLALLLQACASPREEQVSEQERAAYAQAVAALPQNPDAARQGLEAFLRSYPNGGLADDAAESLANIALAQGDLEAEQRWLRHLLAQHPDGSRSDPARVRLAKLEYGAGNFDGARRVLGPVRVDELSGNEAVEAYELFANLSEDPARRLYWLAQARRAAADETLVQRLDSEIGLQLAALSDEDLLRAESQLGRDIPAGRLQLQRAARALGLGEFEAAGELLARAERLALTPADQQSLEALRQRIALRELAGDAVELPTFAEVAERGAPVLDGATGSIGVVLPLSGPFARYGEESLRGILLAARVFDERSQRSPEAPAQAQRNGDNSPYPLSAEQSPRSGVRLVIRDSRGDPQQAAAAVRELAEDENVLAIVGPLLSGPSEAAAVAAEDARVPLLTLTSRESVPRERSYVFRVRTTPDDEVRVLVDYAFETLKARRFAILHPDDGYGRGMRDRFWERVEEQGGRVVGVSGYDPEGTDFAKAIRRMIGYELLTRAEKDALQEREVLMRRARRLEPEVAAVVRDVAYAIRGPEGDPLPPRVDFDVVFIPDSHEKVVLLAPQLAFHEVTGVRLMGPEGWNHPDLVKIARKHVRGAVIASPFHKDSRFDFVSSFVASYEATFEGEPQAMAAQAFDATNLVQLQLARGQDSRDGVREGVIRTKAYPGSSGVITLLPDGNARKRPFLLGVRGGSIVALD
jgi:ABC-type branched-subunit amino acid transport system substrate-binding protein/predicted negative regulator of RcsB-dependent stress response